jgi:hypothetical protein
MRRHSGMAINLPEQVHMARLSVKKNRSEPHSMGKEWASPLKIDYGT